MIIHSHFITQGDSMLVVGAYGRTPLLFRAWDIFRYDFQSRGCKLERKSLLFHVKASFDPPIYLVKK